jgi:hypothetical protein
LKCFEARSEVIDVSKCRGVNVIRTHQVTDI